jgi:phage baseplate assembly protein W
VASVIPHFDIPLRYNGATPAVVDQDTVEDIINCVEVAIRTTQGQRIEIPDFGIPDLTFSQQPVPVQEIFDTILKYEPRATILIDQNPSVINQMIAEIKVRVSAQEVTGA